MSINQLILPYPDFILNQILDPEQFDLNNAFIRDKVNELVIQLNATGVSIDNIITAVNNVLTKDNITPFYPSGQFNPATKGYVDGVIAGVILGQFPDGSITNNKLSNLPNQVKSDLSILNLEVQDMIKTSTIVIPTTGWVANTGDYQYKNILTLNGCTNIYTVTATIVDPDNLDVAMDAGIAPTVTEGENTLTVYAKSIPTSPIQIKCLMVRGFNQPLGMF